MSISNTNINQNNFSYTTVNAPDPKNLVGTSLNVTYTNTMYPSSDTYSLGGHREREAHLINDLYHAIEHHNTSKAIELSQDLEGVAGQHDHEQLAKMADSVTTDERSGNGAKALADTKSIGGAFETAITSEAAAGEIGKLEHHNSDPALQDSSSDPTV